MNKAIEFLHSCPAFYVATVEDGQPRVRPFGAIAEYNGKTYITTNNTKNVFKQMKANPKIEICAMNANRNWIRITGEAVADPDIKAKEEMLKVNPRLTSLYSLDDGIFEVLYLKNGKAVIFARGEEPEEFDID